eukprot:378451_1
MSTSMVYDKQSKLFYVPVKDKDWREFNTLIVDSLVELDWHNNIISMTPIGRCRCPKMINVDDEIHIISWKKHIIVNKKTKSITQAHLKPNTKFSEKTLLWLPTKNCIVGVLNLEDQRSIQCGRCLYKFCLRSRTWSTWHGNPRTSERISRYGTQKMIKSRNEQHLLLFENASTDGLGLHLITSVVDVTTGEFQESSLQLL